MDNRKIIIDNTEFKIRNVKLPVPKFKGNKNNYIGFDSSIFKNRFRNYGIEEKKELIFDILVEEFGINFYVNQGKTEYILFDLDLYIDIRLDYKHNFNAFNQNNVFHVDCLNELIGKNEIEIIKTWCIDDVKRRENMIKENKNYLEIFNFENVEDLLSQICRTIYIAREYSEKILKKELSLIEKIKGNYSSSSRYNKIICYFNPHIFLNENIYYKNPILRRKHIENCMFLQYKKEHELSEEDILINFRYNKYSGYYSYFSIHWVKMFLQEYQNKIDVIFDPFGGWGHRYLGFLQKKYIYNDYWDLSYNGAKEIHEFCKNNIQNLEEKQFFNQDVTKFDFKNKIKYDTIFTCPPYFNQEEYDGKIFKSSDDFLIFWKKTLQNVIHKKLKIFAFVIRDRYAEELLNICYAVGLKLEKKQILGKNIQHHYNRKKQLNFSHETLYVLNLL